MNFWNLFAKVDYIRLWYLRFQCGSRATSCSCGKGSVEKKIFFINRSSAELPASPLIMHSSGVICSGISYRFKYEIAKNYMYVKSQRS